MLSNHGDAWSVLPLTLSLDFSLNGLADGQLTGPLADLSQVSSRKALCNARQVLQIHILQEGGKTDAKGKRNTEMPVKILKYTILFVCLLPSSKTFFVISSSIHVETTEQKKALFV